MINRLSRWSPLVGIAFFVCLVVAFVGPSTPDVNDSGAKVINFYSSHRGALKLQTYALAYGALFLIAFASVLTTYLRRAGVDTRARMALCGAVVMGVGMILGATSNAMLSHKSVRLTPGSAQTLNVLSNDLPYIALIAGLGLMMLSVSAAIFGTKALPSSLAWTALVIGVVAVSGTPLGWFAVMAFGLWVPATSIVLFRRMSATASQITLPDAPAAEIPRQEQPQQQTLPLRG